MDPNNIASGFSSMLSNLKQQQAHWSTNFKMPTGASHQNIVEAFRAAFLTQSLLDKKPVREEAYIGVQSTMIPTLNVGSPIYESSVENIYLLTSGILLYSEEYETLTIFADKSEADAIVEKIESSIKKD